MYYLDFKGLVQLIDLLNNKFIDKSEKGVNIATLDQLGKITSSQIPSYLDNIIEGYYYNNIFYKDSNYTIPITGEAKKIYVDISSDRAYRWNGLKYVLIAGGASMLYKGTAVAHYPNYNSIPRDIYISEGDLIILDTSFDYNEISEFNSYSGYEQPSIAEYINAPDHRWNVTKASTGDMYRIRDNLWQAQINDWADLGSFKGETGNSGVWYGNTTPPPEYDVWIDPSGTTLDTNLILKGKYKTVHTTTNIVVSEQPASGTEIDVIYINDGNTSVTVTANAQVYKTITGSDLVVTIPPGMYGEINFTNVNGVIYVRGD